MRYGRAVGTITAVGAIAIGLIRGAKDDQNGYENKLGMKMIRIRSGKFRMGNDLPTDPAKLQQPALFANGDYDEKPVHEVAITYDFFMSETEVTVEQFQKFRMDYQDAGRFSPYVTGINWYDAAAFCEWLSKSEKKHYRLPTEAEWEYAARAGTASLFPSGDVPPKSGEPNAWGLKNMNTDALEWVNDWYGPYPFEPQLDPVGPSSGWSKVVRGGGIMGTSDKQAGGLSPYYRRSANRASVAPQYTGVHPIGFRVVEAAMPATNPTPVQPAFPEQFIKQNGIPVQSGPDPRKPWFRQRPLLPIPPENATHDAILAAGLDPAINGHNHSAGVTVCPNGDVLWIAFSASSTSTEYLPNTAFIISRLRFGSDEWDLPALFYDFADVNDQSALLWTDNKTVHFFGGGVGLTRVPFRWQSTQDNGATWTAVRFPLLDGPVGGYSPQPITSAFRDKNGTMYVSSDAVGGQSLLWGSKNNGETWFDTGGRTAGRHTAFVVLRDGSILGMGGKNTDIDGFMPQAVSRDGGRTWTASKSPFPALGSNQRPTIIRLASGRLFFASDYQSRRGEKPAGVNERGAFVALSDDDGKSWKVKKIASALPHEGHVLPKRAGWANDYHGEATLGYTVAAQGPNELIHLITSMNHPSQEFELNEAWILSDSPAETGTISEQPGKAIRGDQLFREGKIQGAWSGATDASGRFLLQGVETWSYPSGAKQYEVTWRNGRKTGIETYWTEDGHKLWTWQRSQDGSGIWTQYWPNGNRKSESHWKQGRATGGAVSWSPMGEVIKQYEFRDGDLLQ